MSEPTSTESVFKTPWFELVARKGAAAPASDPYYYLVLPDYVSIVATTESDKFVLVRQFRAPLDRRTLEIPSGRVDEGETPEQAARRELLEETGYRAESLRLLGALTTDTGRLSNRMWCYYAPAVTPPSATWREEPGVETILFEPDAMRAAILHQEFDHALHVAAVLLAAWKGEVRSLGPGSATSAG